MKAEEVGWLVLLGVRTGHGFQEETVHGACP